MSSHEYSELLSDCCETPLNNTDTLSSSSVPVKQDEPDLSRVLEEELSPANILPSLDALPTTAATTTDQLGQRHRQATALNAPPTITATRSLQKDLNSEETFTGISLQDISTTTPNKATKKMDVDEHFMNDSPSSIKYRIANKEGVDSDRNTDVADLLSPMRDSKALSDIKQVI